MLILQYARLAKVTVESLIDDELELPTNDSENYVRVRIEDLMANHKKYLACPGCGAELEKDAETGHYVCGDCDSDWEAYEVLDSNF
jgi:DNA-directed RNA polymerase subunit RPC12/RpoP